MQIDFCVILSTISFGRLLLNWIITFYYDLKILVILILGYK